MAISWNDRATAPVSHYGSLAIGVTTVNGRVVGPVLVERVILVGRSAGGLGAIDLYDAADTSGAVTLRLEVPQARTRQTILNTRFATGLSFIHDNTGSVIVTYRVE